MNITSESAFILSALPVLLIAILFSAVFFFFFRCFPLWKTKNQGCDAFYFLLCAEQFRNSKKLPIVLPPYFMLENAEQWYPPVFSMFLSLFPENWLQRNHWIINQLLDLMLITFGFIIVANFYSIPLAMTIIFVYAIKTPLIMEFRGLTSRPLALLFASLFIFSTYYSSMYPSFITIAMSVSLGVLIIYTHKLSIQLLWFLMPFLSIVYLNPIWFSYLLLSYLFAFLIWPSFFIKIIRAHYDITAFWAKNWPMLGAHPVKQSPLYGRNEVKTQYFQQGGIKGLLNIFRTMGHLNYWILFVPYAILEYANLSSFEHFLLFVVVGIYIWSIVTWIVPQMRFIGLGQQYVKYAYIPNLILVAAMLTRLDQMFYFLLAGFCLLLSLRQYAIVAKELRKADLTQTGFLSTDLQNMIEHIKTLHDPKLMCLPFHYADLLAYSSRKPVLWGGHTYGFKMMQDVFPVLMKPIQEIVQKYALTHLLIKKEYCAIETLGFKKNSIIHESNDFILLSFIERGNTFV